MYRKNVAGQHIYFCLVNATTGAALTGATVTAYRALGSASQASATGTTTELANGHYRFNLSQADTNADYGSYLFTATNAVPVEKTVVFTAANPTDAGAFGLSAINTIEGDTNATLSVVNSLDARVPATLIGGRMDASVGAMAANTLTASALATDAVTEIQAGLALESTSTNIQSRLPAALVSGRMDASIGAMAANTLTASALATDAADEIAGAVFAYSITQDSFFTVMGNLDNLRTNLTAMLELDGAVYRWTTNALEQAPSGGATDWSANERTAIRSILGFNSNGTVSLPSVGVMDAIKDKTDLITSGSISVLPDRVNDNTITMQYNESTSATVNLDEDTTTSTLQFVVARPDGTDVLTIANGSITRTSTSFTVTITTAVTATIGQYLWSLRDLSGGGNRVVTKGVLTVQNAAAIDA